MTDMNASIFDAAHHYAGCIPGIHEVLRRQGFLEDIGAWTCGNHSVQVRPTISTA